MTEKEAGQILKDNFPKTCKMVNGSYEGGFDDTECDFGKALLLAISALNEIGQYRAIGTVDDFKQESIMKSVMKEFLNDKDIVHAIEELTQYRSVGTVEECREAMERQKPQIPNIWGDGCDDSGNVIYDMYDCPNCGKSYEIDYDDYKYCPECGQAVDRSDIE